jgi:hypothetical protein
MHMIQHEEVDLMLAGGAEAPVWTRYISVLRRAGYDPLERSAAGGNETI